MPAGDDLHGVGAGQEGAHAVGAGGVAVRAQHREGIAVAAEAQRVDLARVEHGRVQTFAFTPQMSRAYSAIVRSAEK